MIGLSSIPDMLAGMWNDIELLQVDEHLLVLTRITGLSAYDFSLKDYIPCRKVPLEGGFVEKAIARVGAWVDSDDFYKGAQRRGLDLYHKQDDHLRCSRLSHWYGLIPEHTPKSIWFDRMPSAAEIEQHLSWPVFMKGDRQTSRHRRKLSILRNREDFASAVSEYQKDSILKWQDVVFRSFVPLRLVEDSNPEFIPQSFEFRTFWWKQKLVGCGPYWTGGRKYDLDRVERKRMLALAETVAQRLQVTFLVVDLAQTAQGDWVVIECNDGQESGYAGVSPLGLWERILQIEKAQDL